jgi:hypothetical protein
VPVLRPMFTLELVPPMLFVVDENMLSVLLAERDKLPLTIFFALLRVLFPEDLPPVIFLAEVPVVFLAEVLVVFLAEVPVVFLAEVPVVFLVE